MRQALLFIYLLTFIHYLHAGIHSQKSDEEIQEKIIEIAGTYIDLKQTDLEKSINNFVETYITDNNIDLSSAAIEKDQESLLKLKTLCLNTTLPGTLKFFQSDIYRDALKKVGEGKTFGDIFLNSENRTQLIKLGHKHLDMAAYKKIRETLSNDSSKLMDGFGFARRELHKVLIEEPANTPENFNNSVYKLGVAVMFIIQALVQ